MQWNVLSCIVAYCSVAYVCIAKGSLDVKLPTWTDGKAEMGRDREEKRREEKRREEKRREERRKEEERRKKKKNKKEKRKSQKKEDPGARKGRKVAKHCVFPMICGSGGSISRLAKAASAEPAGQMRDEKLRSTFLSQNAQNTSDVKEVHAAVAPSTFSSQNIQNTSCSVHFNHFWKLRCRNSARNCGAKHISKSKCTKHTRFGALLEVEMSKKCTPWWRARSTFRSQ